jgi:hypothetical protein
VFRSEENALQANRIWKQPIAVTPGDQRLLHVHYRVLHRVLSYRQNETLRSISTKPRDKTAFSSLMLPLHHIRGQCNITRRHKKKTSLMNIQSINVDLQSEYRRCDAVRERSCRRRVLYIMLCSLCSAKCQYCCHAEIPTERSFAVEQKKSLRQRTPWRHVSSVLTRNLYHSAESMANSCS